MLNKNILVTVALDYANGDLHLGHLLEKIQADIWARWQKLLGNNCIFIGGDDAHGTPIMLKAKEQNISPEQLINNYFLRHQEDLKFFNIDLDNFYTTNSPENQQYVTEIYNKLLNNKDIEVKEVEQFYDVQENIFLPDRYVKGQCPKCNALEQYGDNCEVCSAHYDTFLLKNPISILSNSKPITKKSLHYFFKLSNYWQFLTDWIKENRVNPAILHKLNEWLANKESLRDWDISRDAPYFGFLIPGTKDKYFYVWLDAPIGYLAIFHDLCNKNNKNIKLDYFSNSELYHFIGKDIVYFHTLFWPAILRGAGYRTPTKILVHGFLTINGEKMSKSKGTFITVRQYRAHLSAEYLRYYFAAKLTDGIDDLDFNFEDFVARVNADLVGKFANIASRCAKFINNNFNNKLAENLDSVGLNLYHQLINAKTNIAKLFIDLHYNKAIKEIMHLADLANQYIDHNKPWVLIKNQNSNLLVWQVCTTGINLFKVLAVYLKPVLPETTKIIENFLNIKLDYNNVDDLLINHEIKQFKPLINRIDMEQVNKILENNNINNINIINIEDFNKIDLRVASVINAEHVEGAEKLLKLTLDVGELGIKTVFSGIKAAYMPEQLINKLVVVVANLKERKMRFGVSQGMVLVAGGDNQLWILEPNIHAKAGMRIT